MGTMPDRTSEHVEVYECGGSLYRVNGRVECLMGTEWVPSHLTEQALKEAGARALTEEERERMNAPA
jgi:hypothetical protein